MSAPTGTAPPKYPPVGTTIGSGGSIGDGRTTEASLHGGLRRQGRKDYDGLPQMGDRSVNYTLQSVSIPSGTQIFQSDFEIQGGDGLDVAHIKIPLKDIAPASDSRYNSTERYDNMTHLIYLPEPVILEVGAPYEFTLTPDCVAQEGDFLWQGFLAQETSEDHSAIDVGTTNTNRLALGNQTFADNEAPTYNYSSFAPKHTLNGIGSGTYTMRYGFPKNFLTPKRFATEMHANIPTGLTDASKTRSTPLLVTAEGGQLQIFRGWGVNKTRINAGNPLVSEAISSTTLESSFDLGGTKNKSTRTDFAGPQFSHCSLASYQAYFPLAVFELEWMKGNQLHWNVEPLFSPTYLADNTNKAGATFHLTGRKFTENNRELYLHYQVSPIQTKKDVKVPVMASVCLDHMTQGQNVAAHNRHVYPTVYSFSGSASTGGLGAGKPDVALVSTTDAREVKHEVVMNVLRLHQWQECGRRNKVNFQHKPGDSYLNLRIRRLPTKTIFTNYTADTSPDQVSAGGSNRNPVEDVTTGLGKFNLQPTQITASPYGQ